MEIIGAKTVDERTSGTSPLSGTSCLCPSGMRGLLITGEERRLAQTARAAAHGRSVLYHGTRYASLIVQEDQLRCPDVGSACISFTRSPEVAAFSAMLPRDDTTEGPSILVLDRISLQTRYRLEPFHDVWMGDGDQIRDEAEEIVSCDITDLHRHLAAVATTSAVAGLVPSAPLAIASHEHGQPLLSPRQLACWKTVPWR